MKTGAKASLIGVAALMVVVVGAVIAVMMINDGRTPDQAVRDYVRLIAKGDGAAADAVVAPGDPAAARALRSAGTKMTVRSVQEVLPSGGQGTTSVDVEYAVGLQPGSATLRVRKAPGFHPLTRYQVLDPLVVPAYVQTTVPALATAWLGAVRVPADGLDAQGHPRRRPTRLYPGVYPVRAQASPYLTPRTEPAAVAADVSSDGEGGTPRPVVAGVGYTATTKLQRFLDRRITTHVRACIAAGPKMHRDCPADLQDRKGMLRHVKITEPFRLQTIEADGHHTGDTPLYFSAFPVYADGFAITVYGRVGVTAGGTVTVRFDAL